jgi:rubrerythrin
MKNSQAGRKKIATGGAKRPRARNALSIEELMRHAYVMESEAAERYAECADVLEAHNNRETASLFRTLARIEKIHSEQVLSSMGWDKAPLPTTLAAEAFDDEIEGVDPTELHYRMHAYHALNLALRGEQRAQRFYSRLADRAADAQVRRAARAMARDEAEHVRLIEEWLKRTPAPAADWSTDHDPPQLGD